MNALTFLAGAWVGSIVATVVLLVLFAHGERERLIDQESVCVEVEQ